MRKSLILGTAAMALLIAPLAIAQSSFLNNGAMTVDSQRGVLTMAPLLERVTPPLFLSIFAANPKRLSYLTEMKSYLSAFLEDESLISRGRNAG